jgi:hypothetical protein
LLEEVLAFARMTMHFPVVGVINDHLIDGFWYGNTDQRGNSVLFLAGNTPEERAAMTYTTQVLLKKNKSLLLLNLI